MGVGQGPVDPREELFDSYGGSSLYLSPIILGSREFWLLIEASCRDCRELCSLEIEFKDVWRCWKIPEDTGRYQGVGRYRKMLGDAGRY